MGVSQTLGQADPAAEEVEEEVEEQRKAKVLRAPTAPTQAEVEEHEATGHVIHRSWCPHCVRARGDLERHRPAAPEEKSHPTISFDYFFFSEEDQPHLQVKDDVSGMIWSSAIPAKGADQFTANFLAACVAETGYRRVILKMDNEPSIKALKALAIKAMDGVEAIPEESKTGDSRANGRAEVSVRETKREVRALVSDLETRIGKSNLPDSHPILTWVSRHSDFLVSRYRIGKDGRTPYERLKGKRWKLPCVCFGEKVWFRPLPAYAKKVFKSDIYPQVLSGHYVGTHGRNGDALIMTDKGVLRGGSLRRMSPEERWDASDFMKIKGLPWKLFPEEYQARETPAVVKVDLPAMEGPSTVATRASGARNLYVMKSDVENDPTPGCPGCTAILVGAPALTHSQVCRGRIQEKLMQTAEGRARVNRAMKRKNLSMDGRPDVKDIETDAGVALGAPESDFREGKRKPETTFELQKKNKLEERGSKRVGDSLEDLYWDQQVEVGGASGSAAPGATMSHDAFWSPVIVHPPAEGTSQTIGQTAPEEPPAAAAQEGLAPTESGGDEEMNKDANVLELAQLVAHELCEEESKDQSVRLAGLLHGLGRRAVKESRSDVAEIYNPKRFTPVANRLGLKAGFAVDLEIQKEDGSYWDLTKRSDVEEVKALLAWEKPLFLMGSPPCGSFSPLQALNTKRVDPVTASARLEEGRVHLNNSVECYEAQLSAGRLFLHEHPRGAKSWDEPCMKRLTSRPDVYVVDGPMCRWKMKSCDASGEGYVKKMTRWVTNSEILAKILKGECSGTLHRHVHLVNGRAREAQKYPAPLVRAILKGVQKELLKVGELSSLSSKLAGPVPEEPEPEVDWDSYKVPSAGKVYYDSNTGAELDPEQVVKARTDELGWIHRQKVYTKVPLEECYQNTGHPPITLKWLDRNKGDEQRPNYRSRLVVREVKKSSRTDVLPEHESFSAMPPLEALKLLCSIMVSTKTSKAGKPLKLKLYDISRAHFYGESRRKVYTNLPEGDESPGHCALLLKTMYGTQDASSVWQETYTELLKQNGITHGQAWPAVFCSKSRDIKLLVHGDDFLVLGDEDAQNFLSGVLAQKFEFRVDGCIGPEDRDGTVLTVLNRIVEYNKDTGTITYEADPRHAEMIVKTLGLESAKVVSTPSEKQTLDEVLTDMALPTVASDRISLFRSVVMRAAYLAQDRADIAEAVKTLARRMQGPTESDFTRLKRLGRFLKGKPRVVTVFRPQQAFNKLRCYVDSDHAGCLITRRSTTGLVLMAGRHCIKASSNLQSTISLSSGESEFYAIVKGTALVLSMAALLAEWDYPVTCAVSSDSSAARGTCSRRGLGKLRHVQTRYLWVQERVQRKEVVIDAVGTHHNVSDMCTKTLPADVVQRHMSAMGQLYKEGRSQAAKKAV